MKAYRITIVVLLLIVGWLGYMVVSSREKPGAPQPEELWHTNAVEVWHTNTIDVWHTNTVTAPAANAAVQTVTNEVVKEVPARLTPLQMQAANLGYKLLKAPLLQNPTDALFKASPLAVDVEVDANVANILNEDGNALKQSMARMLNSRGFSVADESPYHLRLRLSALWRTDVPRVELMGYRLELTQTITAKRQEDLLDMPGTVWSAGTAKLINLNYLPADAEDGLQQLLNRFNNDYQKAKASQSSIESQLPKVPADFLPQAK